MIRGALYAATLVTTYLLSHAAALCAEKPLVVEELEVARNIAAAELQQALAEQALADWRLAQFEELRSKRHASWQELAEQEVATQAAQARTQAAEQFLRLVLEEQARLEAIGPFDSALDTECIRLFVPGSSRLAAWLPVEVASSELCRRHIEHLRSELEEVKAVEQSALLADIKTAEQAVAAGLRFAPDSVSTKRDKYQLQLAEAKYDLAQARQNRARVITRRIELSTEAQERHSDDTSSLALAEFGTRFVDMTVDRDLARLAQEMVSDHRLATIELDRLQHELQAILDRAAALETLSQVHNWTDTSELIRTRQQQAELAQELEELQEILAWSQQLANEYGPINEIDLGHDAGHTASSACGHEPAHDASMLRHSLELAYLRLYAAADRASVDAEKRYWLERLERVAGMSLESRHPEELERLNRTVEAVRLKLEFAEQKMLQLEREQQRVALQFDAQQREAYQLIQLADGQFITRQEMERSAALIAMLGVVGHAAPLPSRPSMLAYIESPNLLFSHGVSTSDGHGRMETDCFPRAVGGISIRYSRFLLGESCDPGGAYGERETTSIYRTMLSRNAVTSVCRSMFPFRDLASHRHRYSADLFCPMPYGRLRVPYYRRVSHDWMPYRRPPYRSETLSCSGLASHRKHEFYHEKPLYQRDNLLLKYGRWSADTHRSPFYYNTIVSFSDPFARPYTRSPYHRSENYLETRYLNRTHQSRPGYP